MVLDRFAFEERCQGPAESFDDFYISLRRFADATDLCGTCLDSRTATRIIAGIRDSETKKKLLALSPFPTTQAAVYLCRSEESARANKKVLSSQTGVASIQNNPGGGHSASDTSPCGACGRSQHPAGQTCPAKGKTCHICGKANHFATRCPANADLPAAAMVPVTRAVAAAVTTKKTDGGSGQKSKMTRIHIGNVKATLRDRRTPIISVELLDGNGVSKRSFDNVTPDPGAEVSVGGLNFLSAIRLKESDLSSSSFDLVMVDKSAPLLSIG